MSAELISSMDRMTYLQFTIELHFDVIQEAKIKLLSNNILFVLLEDESSTMVSSFDTPKEIIGNIISVTLR